MSAPDLDYGLVVADEGGAAREGVSVALQTRGVQMVATGTDGDIALLTLRARDCRELGEWLVAAADRLATVEVPR